MLRLSLIGGAQSTKFGGTNRKRFTSSRVSYDLSNWDRKKKQKTKS